MHKPVISILMVARNTAPFVDAALRSARAQTLGDIEIVFVDDGSVDGTDAIARRHAAHDPRVRVLAGPRAGLSTVRNASLAAARAPLVIVLDSDDLLHPRHCEMLLHAHQKSDHEICAANMIEFRLNQPWLHSRRFAAGEGWEIARQIDTAEYLQSGMIGGREVSLGYLKPLLNLAFLRRHGLAYDERLRIGEDMDLVLRVMLAGGRMLYVPQPTYFYRRHSESTSHRLSIADCEGLLEATKDYDAPEQAELSALIAARRDNLTGAIRHLHALAAIKRGRLAAAWGTVAADPIARTLTYRSLAEALAKRIRMSEQTSDGETAMPLKGDMDLLAILTGLCVPKPGAGQQPGWPKARTTVAGLKGL